MEFPFAGIKVEAIQFSIFSKNSVLKMIPFFFVRSFSSEHLAVLDGILCLHSSEVY